MAPPVDPDAVRPRPALLRVGAPLARMEARIAVSRMLARFPAPRADRSARAVASPRGAVTFGRDDLPALFTRRRRGAP